MISSHMMASYLHGSYFYFCFYFCFYFYFYFYFTDDLYGLHSILHGLLHV